MGWKIEWLVAILTTQIFIATATLPSTTSATFENESSQEEIDKNSVTPTEYLEVTASNNFKSGSQVANNYLANNENRTVNSKALLNRYKEHPRLFRKREQVVITGRNSQVDNDNKEMDKKKTGKESYSGDKSTLKEQNIIDTTFGPVQGHNWQDSDEILSFIDIPYGKFKSFEAPTDPVTWGDVRDITTHNVQCPQLVDDKYVGIPDCLTLSVFTPKNAKNAGVLFYIHESDFQSGSGSPSIYSPEHIVKKGIVLVLPNYRLGPLGFLCLQNVTAPGNAALKDLTLALKWSKKNIEAFGGDPNNIVVSGDGTSAALAGYLALSPESKKYISKIITDSGSMLSHWAIDREPIKTATKLANKIKIIQNEDQHCKSIFTDIDFELLITAAKDIQLRPCKENSNNESFIERNPWAIITKEKFNLTFIIGSASHAGLKEAIQHDNATLLELNKDFADALPNDLVFEDDNTKNDVVKKVKEQYFGTEDINTSKMENFSMYHTDASYLGPDLRLAKALVNAGATVFMYEFSFMGDLNKELQNIDEELRFGATRGDIVGYLFNTDNKELGSKEKKIVELVVDMWVSFIETGHPTAEEIEWNHLNNTSGSDGYWLSIDEDVTLMTGFHPDRLDLWTKIYEDHFIDGNKAIDVKPVHYYYVVFVCMLKFANKILL